MNAKTYAIDIDALTVVFTDKNGERFDLNADGEPCETADDLRAFIRELRNHGAFSAETAAELLAEVDANA